MVTDLFTVRPEDVIDLAVRLMEWRHVRHVPVEDDAGVLIGLITHRHILRLFDQAKPNASESLLVRDVMKTDLFSIAPQTPSLDALQLMRENNIGCLPVVDKGKLVGLITAYDFLTVSTKLFEERLKALI